MIRGLRRHPWLAAAFALFAGLALWLLVDALDLARGFGGGERTIEPWMTVGVVGHAWDLNPREIDRIADLPTPEAAGRPLTLREIAASRGVPVEEVIAEVEAAIQALRGPDGDEGPRDGTEGPRP